MYGYIYLTTNLINGKMYVGKHKSSYFDESYKGSGKILWNAIRKYGWENFKVELLKECDNEEDLSISEYDEIEHRNAVLSPNYYNLRDGGRGGWKVNGVSIKRGIKVSDQARLNISLAHQGKSLSFIHRKHIGMSLQGDNNPLRRTGSEVARRNLSESMKGNQNARGCRWITNGTESLIIRASDEIPEGFYLGNINPGFSKYKYRWMTKDSQNLKVRREFVDQYLLEGWKLGRYISSRRATTIESITEKKFLSE